MTRAELENIIEERNILNMEHCRQELIRLGKPMSIDEIIRVVTSNEVMRINKELGEDHAYELEQVTHILKNFSFSTAARQKENLREGKKVTGPYPINLDKNVKTYYSQLEIAAVMYLQSQPAISFLKPSLARLLETRHG